MRISDWSSDVCSSDLGAVVANILQGFGCTLLAFDPVPDEILEQRGVTYVPFPELMERSDIVTIHCPLTPQTHHLIDANSLKLIREGAMLINTSRGAVVDTRAVIAGLKSGRIGADRRSVVSGKSGSVRVDLGGRREIK